MLNLQERSPRESFVGHLSTLTPKGPNFQIWLKFGHDQFFSGKWNKSGNFELFSTRGSGSDRHVHRSVGDAWQFLTHLSLTEDGGVFYIPTQPGRNPVQQCIVATDDIGIEMDEGSRDEQVNRYQEFTAVTGLYPASVLSSGGVSLHGHFKGDRHFPLEQAQYLRRLGVLAFLSDPVTVRPHQPMRFAGFYRKEKGQYQSLLYCNPNARYSYAELIEGFRKWFAQVGWAFPESIPDDWWKIFHSKLKGSAKLTRGDRFEFCKDALGFGLDGWQQQKALEQAEREQRREQRQKQWAEAASTNLLELVEQAKDKLGLDAFDDPRHNWKFSSAGHARGCCTFHDSKSGNSAWISSNKGFSYHCSACTDDRPVDAFGYWWATQNGNNLGIPYPKGKDYVQAAIAFLGWAGVAIPADVLEFKPRKQKGDRPKKVVSIEAGKGELLNRTVDLHIGKAEFKERVSEFPKTGIVALYGAQGSGKGEAIAQMLDRSWLSYTTLRSLARDQEAGWGGVYVPDGDIVNGQLLKDGMPVLGGSVCVHSALKTRSYKPKILVLDEEPTLTDTLTESKLCNKDGVRGLLIEEVARKVREADLVIVASADLREEGLRWLENIRGEQAYLIKTDRLPLQWDAAVMNGDGGKDQAIAEIINHAENLPAGKLITVHCDAKSAADQISALLLDAGIKSLLITSTTSGEQIERSFLNSKGRDIPDLLMMGIKAIVTSPSVKEGFSIQRHTDAIDSVWGIFEGGSITAESAAQTLNRVRSLAPRNVWIAQHGRKYSRLSHAETIAGFLRDLKRASTVKAELVKRSLKTETLSEIAGIDWFSSNLRLLADGEVRRNRGMKEFRATVLGTLVREGKTVSTYKFKVSEAEVSTLKEKREAVRDRLRMEHAIAVEKQPLISEAERAELEEKPSLSYEETLRLTKYYLQAFYRTEADRYLVLEDKDGELRKQIHNLEMILSPEKAEQETAFSIEQNKATPQDWKSARLQLELLERSGFADLVRRVWAGEATDLDQVEVFKLGTYFKEHSDEFEIAFNFKNAHIVSEMQLVAHCFDWCGIKRESTQRRVNGKQQRFYSVNAKNLQKLKAIVERRSQPVTPPQTDMDIGGGVTYTDPILLEVQEAMEFLKIAPEARAEILAAMSPEAREVFAA